MEGAGGGGGGGGGGHGNVGSGRDVPIATLSPTE